MQLGAVISTLVTGLVVDRIGRRLSGLMAAFPFFVGGLLLGVSNSVGLLCTGRFLAGEMRLLL